MKPRKYRLRIRLHRKIYDLLEMEALWQDSKIGTLANRILQEELAKLRQVGLDHCVCGDEDAASARRIEAEKHPERYYMLPSFDCRCSRSAGRRIPGRCTAHLCQRSGWCRFWFRRNGLRPYRR